MGSFFTNVQLRFPPERETTDVAGALAQWIGEQGYEAVGGGAPFDRTVILARHTDWIAVYDEGTDTGAVALDDLGGFLSSFFEAAAITVRVHDSDVLELELFERGERIDSYNSAPDYFEKRSDEDRALVAGNAERWTHLLAKGHDAPELAEAFGERRLFCEETLGKVAVLLGIDASLACTGFRYAASGDGSSATNLVPLRFRLRERPGYEERVEGPPHLGHRYGMDRLPTPHAPTTYDLMVGSPMQVSASARNLGGMSRGVEVIVEGEALDRGDVQITTMNVVVGLPQEGNWAEATPEACRDENARIRVIAKFHEITIPAGIAGDVDELMRRHRDKIVDLMHVSNVHVNVIAEALRPGTSTLRVTITPLEARDRAFTEECVLAIKRAAPRPLRAEAQLYPHQLAPLEGRGTLFLLVSFDASREEAARFAARAALDWRPFLGDPGKLHASVFHSDPGARPSNEMPAWDVLEEAFRHTQVLSVATPALPMQGGSGFSFGGAILPLDPSEHEKDPECPTLALWLDVRGGNAGGQDTEPRASKLLMDLATRAMTKERAIQALVGRWDWAPGFYLATTPYESVCGIHFNRLRRSWLKRFLRGVAPGTLWLGEDLVSRIDRAAIDRVTPSSQHDKVLRLTIPDDIEAIHAVEVALAPILPSSEDAHAEDE